MAWWGKHWLSMLGMVTCTVGRLSWRVCKVWSHGWEEEAAGHEGKWGKVQFLGIPRNRGSNSHPCDPCLWQQRIACMQTKAPSAMVGDTAEYQLQSCSSPLLHTGALSSTRVWVLLLILALANKPLDLEFAYCSLRETKRRRVHQDYGVWGREVRKNACLPLSWKEMWGSNWA